MDSGSTHGFGMAVSPQVEEYLWEIAEEMAERFGISRAEAVARIAHEWGDMTFEPENDLIFHELPEYWAHVLGCERTAASCWGAAEPGPECRLRAAPPAEASPRPLP